MDDATGTPPEPQHEQPIAIGPVEPSAEPPSSLDPVVPIPQVPPASPKKKREGSFLKELPILIIIAFGLALLITPFLLQAFFIPAESRVPPLQTADRVL